MLLDGELYAIERSLYAQVRRSSKKFDGNFLPTPFESYPQLQSIPLENLFEVNRGRSAVFFFMLSTRSLTATPYRSVRVVDETGPLPEAPDLP